MATMKLVDTVFDLEWNYATIEFSPLLDGFQVPDDQARLVKKMIDGSIRIIKPYKKHLYTIRLNAVSSADYTQFLSWWEQMQELNFYPDTVNDAATYYSVQIVNTQDPFTLMEGKLDTYEGTLSLREI